MEINRHDGKTWLDKELAAQRRTPLSQFGYGRDVSKALADRKRALVERERVQQARSHDIDIPKSPAQPLSQADIEKAGRALAAQKGLTWKPTVPGKYITGTVRGSTMIGSQRFAMMEIVGLDGGFGFSLVPWRTELELQQGKFISGVAMPGGGIEWNLGRGRGLGR